MKYLTNKRYEGQQNLVSRFGGARNERTSRSAKTRTADLDCEGETKKNIDAIDELVVEFVYSRKNHGSEN